MFLSVCETEIDYYICKRIQNIIQNIVMFCLSLDAVTYTDDPVLCNIVGVFRASYSRACLPGDLGWPLVMPPAK